MAFVPYPDDVLTETIGRGWILPQSILESPLTATRQTLVLNTGRWHGIVRVAAATPRAEVNIRNWLARMTPGNNYTSIPTGTGKVLPDAATIAIRAITPSGADVTITGATPNTEDLVGMWLHDGKRARTVVTAADDAGTYSLALWPETPQLTLATTLREITHISAYQRLEDEGLTASPIAEFTVDGQDSIDVLWIERVTPTAGPGGGIQDRRAT